MNVEVLVDKIAFGGDGIASVGGKTCFVEGALPGETVVARVTQDKKHYLKARLVKVLTASPHRVEPPCPYLSSCGGCQYQHVDHAEELRMKESQVAEMLSRGVGLDPARVGRIRHAGRDYGYRNALTLHRTRADERPQRLGFVARDNRSIVPIDRCLLADERFSAVLSQSWTLPKRVEKASIKLASNGDVISDRDEVFYRVKVGPETLIANSKGFFQTNLGVTALLAQTVAGWVGLFSPEVFVDLYAGVGTFTFLSAPQAGRAFCVEENRPSLDALRMNVNEKNRQGIEILQGRAEAVFPSLASRLIPEVLVVCLDPPRQGIERSLARAFATWELPRPIVYVSCDPATLVRDLQIILSGGRYEIDEVVPFDMFPRTKHVETATLLIPR